MAVTPSDQRLHPLTVLFALGGELRNFLFPAILATVTARAGSGAERFLFVFFVPAAVIACLRYLFATYRYDETELVVRTGIIFRNERHIPYARVQSVDAVQNLLHRWFGVVDIKVRTGTGGEAEATLSVLPLAALDEMRVRVFEGRSPEPATVLPGSASDTADGLPAPVPAAETLLRLSPRDLALAGVLDNRGWIVIGAAWGLLWESGVADRFEGWETAGWLTYAFVLGGLFVIAPVLSMLWAVVRLNGFALTRRGGDLRVEYGAMTHVTATIPLRRVQAIKVMQGPGHLWTRRASVRVETAGGSATGRSSSEREWIAPIIRLSDLPGFIAAVLPDAELTTLDWQAVDPRGYRRRRTVALVWAAAVGGATVPWLGGPWAAGLGLLLAMLWATTARFYVRNLGWAQSDRFIAFKTGWIHRVITIVPLDKIQVVNLEASPFDRRHEMASLRVDTAGAGAHRIDIPYLSYGVADDARVSLAREAAATTFRW